MAADPSRLSILSDEPADEDRLGFARYARTLAEIVADPATDTPLTIGVFGGWGRGKTSLMRMVERQLKDTQSPNFCVRTVWFNAWLYSQQQALWRALISRVMDGAQGFPTLGDPARATLRQLEARLYGGGSALASPAGGHLALPRGALAGLEGAALPPLLGLELLRRQAERAGQTEAARRLETLIADLQESEALTRRDQIAALDDFRRQFEHISRDCIADHGRLAVFVDDLDRCLPDRAVEVLEAIKLFLDVPGCIFVLGLARDIVEQGIRVRYQDYQTSLDGAQYLEKIIQIPFSLPPMAPEAVRSYVHEVTRAGLPDPACETVLAVGLEPNPRRLKRTINILLLLWRLAQNCDELRETIHPVRLAKIVVIQQYYPALFELIAQVPYYLIDLERRFREQKERDVQGGGREGAPGWEASLQAAAAPGERSEGGETISAGPLQPFLGHRLLREMLTCTPDRPDANFSGLRPAGVRQYVYLTRSAVEEPGAAGGEAPLPFEPQMVTIPAGAFLMGTPEDQLDEIARLGADRQWIENEVPQHQAELPEYAIGRYPVTNAEFKRFVDDGGYSNREYWTAAGWRYREQEGWAQPRYWVEDWWNDPAQPAVGVSWYEAAAYCNWLSNKTGRPYRLPTEAEWEKAARGTDGRRYAWGNDWDPRRCNSRESASGRATPVGQHPGGDSPYGLGDTMGQVWEWCSSRWGGYDKKARFGYRYRFDDEREELEPDDSRILRGGSWYDDNPAGICRCGSRVGNNPWGRNGTWGFRCARGSSSGS